MNLAQSIVPTFPAISLSFLTSTPILIVGFIVFSVLYIAISWALVYHWSEYGMYSVKILSAEVLFFVVSAVLFSVSILALISL